MHIAIENIAMYIVRSLGPFPRVSPEAEATLSLDCLKRAGYISPVTSLADNILSPFITIAFGGI